MLSAHRVSVEVDQARLLNNVSVDVAPGEIVILIGANGAGKSTLLHVLSGDRSAYQGDVLMDEKSLNTYCPRTLAQRRAVMPQHSPLHFAFSVSDIVEMGRAPHRQECSATIHRAIIEQALELTDLSQLRNRDYTTLSGGEKQRVHLARVLAQVWPLDGYCERYLLLDEPTSSLDIHHQYSMMENLVHISEKGIGILLIAHDLNLASMFADRLVVMKAGEVIAQGHPNEVYRSDVLYEAFSLTAMIGYHPESNRPYVVPKSQRSHQSTYASIAS